MSGKIYCLYHADCSDGVGAAWAVWKKFGSDVECFAVEYSRPCPILDIIEKEDTVIIVDFSYEYPEMAEIRSKCGVLIFLDHHHRSRAIAEALSENDPRPSDTYRFEASVSGAKLAWLHFHPHRSVPMAIEFISDRDLWKFDLAHTKPFMTGMQQYPLELEAWKPLPLERDDFIGQVLRDAPALRRQFDTYRDAIVRQTLRFIELQGYTVPLINVPRMYASEALDNLAKDHPFAIGYYDKSDVRFFSLRSNKQTGVNVRIVAEHYKGGGGHDHASGFEVPRDHPLASI
jgi:uncharacterized protein